ncbi:hypothetical protein GCM10023235_77520 [Kitasatospora terrestris]|uniref:Uncharacterized protein n=1 Tax=Kitasatospora terrestris TaxID=258051 RepID=A0ABP9ERL0_9ACTN
MVRVRAGALSPPRRAKRVRAAVAPRVAATSFMVGRAPDLRVMPSIRGCRDGAAGTGGDGTWAPPARRGAGRRECCGGASGAAGG